MPARTRAEPDGEGGLDAAEPAEPAEGTHFMGGLVPVALARWPLLREAAMSANAETGHVTGTKDKDYNLVWFTESCLSNALRLDAYIQDAVRDGDNEVADLFRRAQDHSRTGAEQAKQLLRSRL
jgi:hypothetical protein